MNIGIADAGSYSSSIKGDVTDKKLKDRNYGYFKSWVFTKDPFTLGSTGVMFDLKDECYDSIADDLPAMRL